MRLVVHNYFPPIKEARDEFKESEHPRGQPENAGQFGSSSVSTPQGKESLASLNKSQKGALQLYTAAGSYPINDFLRNGTKIEEGKYANVSNLRSMEDVKDVIKNMDDVFSNAHLDKDTIVYRGVDNETWNRLQSQLDSGFIEDAGFISTASSRKDITKFSSLTHFMTIKVPKGTKAIPLQNVVNNRTNNEILLNRGTRFRVIKRTRNNVELEVIQ